MLIIIGCLVYVCNLTNVKLIVFNSINTLTYMANIMGQIFHTRLKKIGWFRPMKEQLYVTLNQRLWVNDDKLCYNVWGK